jgi:hypothetical protein
MEEMPGWVFALIIVCFIVLPLLIVFAGVVVVRGALRFRKHGVWVTGTVAEVKTIHNVGEVHAFERYSYQPIFEFEAPDGTMLRGEAGSYGHTNDSPVGTQRQILVDFDNPGMVLVSGSYRLVFGAFMIVFGLVIAGFGGFAAFGSSGG